MSERPMSSSWHRRASMAEHAELPTRPGKAMVECVAPIAAHQLGQTFRHPEPGICTARRGRSLTDQ